MAGRRRFRRGGAAADARRAGGAQAGRARRVRGELPRQRRVPLRRHAGRAGPADRRVPQGAGGDRPGGDDRHHEPVRPPDVQGRGVHRERAGGAPVRAGQGDAQPRPRRGARRADLRLLGRPGGRGVGRGQGHPGRARPVRRRAGLLCAYVLDQGYEIRFAIEPKPNEPRGDILLPTVGHALAFINGSNTPRWSGSTPRSGTRRWPG